MSDLQRLDDGQLHHVPVVHSRYLPDKLVEVRPVKRWVVGLQRWTSLNKPNECCATPSAGDRSQAWVASPQTRQQSPAQRQWYSKAVIQGACKSCTRKHTGRADSVQSSLVALPRTISTIAAAGKKQASAVHLPSVAVSHLPPFVWTRYPSKRLVPLATACPMHDTCQIEEKTRTLQL